MSNILAKTASAQRQDCAACKDTIAVFALHSCYHKALCGNCVSKLRSLFDRKSCFTCGKPDNRVCFTWRPGAEYEDFGDVTGADDKAYDDETGISYEDFGMRNRTRKAIRDSRGRVTTNAEEVARRNACCMLTVKGRHVGSGFLIKVKGHLCVLTSNYMVPDKKTALTAACEFHVQTQDPGLAPDRIRQGFGNCVSHTQPDREIVVKLDPHCYFVTNIILDFSCIAVCIPCPLDPAHVQPIPMPRAWDPEAERIKKEKERKAREEARRKEEMGIDPNEKPKSKYNFVIVKKNKGQKSNDEDARKWPDSRDGLVICGFPVGISDRATSAAGAGKKTEAAGRLALLRPRLRSDVAFLERTENQFIQYTTDCGNGWQGAAVFFNMELYGIHSQPKIKDNSDEAILASHIAYFLDSIRSEAVHGITSGLLARKDSEEVAAIGCRCLLDLLSVQGVNGEPNIHMSQLVRCQAVEALVAATKRWAISEEVLQFSLPCLVTFCRQEVYREWIGKVGGLTACLAVIRSQMEALHLIEAGWECLSLLVSVTPNLHQFAFQDGPSAAITMIRAFVASERVNRCALHCVERAASHSQYHAVLLQMQAVQCVLLSTSAHQNVMEIQVSGCLVVVHLLLSGYPLPCDNSMQLKPLAKAAEPPKPKRKQKGARGGSQRQPRGRRGRHHARGHHEEAEKLEVPLRQDGKRDRQLMKRDRTLTQLSTACQELGNTVNLQPRIIVMRTSGGLDVLFIALKTFPKEPHVVEPCWEALRAVADETRAEIVLRSGHVRVLERSLKKCKKHPKHAEWTATLADLLARNTYTGSKSKKR